jgi:hypothetical protein
MVMPMQDPQSFEDDAGNVYVREGNRYRVVRPGRAAAPAGPQSAIPGMIPMVTPSEQRQSEATQYERGRDVVRDQLAESRELRAVEAAARQAQAMEIANAKLTEDQGKAGGYATLMADAERSYQQALREGFNPTGFRAGLANFTDNIPLMGGVGNFIRDDAGDRARQAELQWTDAQLKAMSGAASPEAEVIRNQITNFARPGQNYDYIGERLEDARRTAFEASRRRAGRDLQGLVYPETDAEPLRIRDLQPGETPESLAARGLVRGADGVWRFPRDEQGNPILPDAVPGAGGSPPAPPAGPTGGGNGPQQRAANGGRGRGPLEMAADAYRNVEAFALGAAEQFPGLDEAAAWTAARLSGVPFSEARQVQGELAQRDREQYGTARNVGGVTGAVAPMAVGVPFLSGANIARAAVNAPRAERLLRFGARTAQNAGLGAAGAGVYAAGAADGGASERVAAGGNALGLGAALGAGAPAVAPVARFADDLMGNIPSRTVTGATEFAMRQGGRAGNALGIPGSQELVERATPNALNPMIDRLGERLGPERVNALAARAQNRRDLGIDPALIDAMDDGGVGLVRAASSRQGTGRQAVIDFYNARRGDLPAQTARIAREEISADTRPALDIIASQRDVRRANASAIDTFGGDEVPLGEDAILALRSDFVRPYIRAAATRAQGATDPVERAASARLSRIADTVLDDPAAARLTVREAQDISKALNDAADSAFRAGSPDGPVLANLARTVRQTARDNSEGYRAWLRQYGEDSDLMEAATRGRNFVSVSQDPINVRGTESFVRGANAAGDAEMAIQRAVSREAVEAAASNPRTARNILDAFANDTGMARRVEALGIDPERLRNRAQAVMESVDTAYRANPRGGSNSILNAGDVDALAGVSEAAQNLRSVARDPFFGGLQVIADSYTRRGFNNAEAEQLARLSVDPTRTDELISLLSERMTRREARREARSVRRRALATTQSGQQSTE